MFPITAVILNKSNQINETVKSISEFGIDEIIIGTYRPTNIKHRNLKVVTLPESNDYSADLNRLIEGAKHEWLAYFKEGEIIVQADLECVQNKIYGFQILKNDIILKEARLWHKKHNLKFKNPVFEKLSGEIEEVIETIVYDGSSNDPKAPHLLEKWSKANPFLVDCHYYKAFIALADKRLKDFKSLISQYLFNSNTDISSTMARYYLAMIQGLFEDETNLAIHNLVLCIAENPLMAEFWCLLGDIFYKNKHYDRATEFYKNGLVLGNRRLKCDLWPMQISKYQEYPNTMMASCEDILVNSKRIYMPTSK